jgi:MraZ protein
MFIGEYSHSIDDKGRLAVPKKFQEDLKAGLVVTKGLDNCLWVYTYESWRELATKLSKLPISSNNNRAFSRLMLAGAMDVSLDKQGRIVLPDYLRVYAKLGKKVVITGLFDRLEIWDEAEWQTYKERTEAESGEIAEQLADLGV